MALKNIDTCRLIYIKIREIFYVGDQHDKLIISYHLNFEISWYLNYNYLHRKVLKKSLNYTDMVLLRHIDK